jgi:hypothetical protein
MRQRQAGREQMAQAQQQQSQATANTGQAFAACMTGRGYTVK